MSDQLTMPEIKRETCYVPATHKGKGRRTAVAPGTTAARFLHYGRITLEADDAPLTFHNGDQESGLVCLNGVANVTSGGESFQLGRYDALYIPRDSEIEVQARDNHGFESLPLKVCRVLRRAKGCQAARRRRQAPRRT